MFRRCKVPRHRILLIGGNLKAAGCNLALRQTLLVDKFKQRNNVEPEEQCSQGSGLPEGTGKGAVVEGSSEQPAAVTVETSTADVGVDSERKTDVGSRSAEGQPENARAAPDANQGELNSIHRLLCVI